MPTYNVTFQGQKYRINAKTPKTNEELKATITARQPTPIQAALKTALGTAKEGIAGAAGAFIPGGRTTIEKPELAGRTALSILAPIPTLAGLGAKKLAQTPKGKELIGKTQERLREVTPTTLPGMVQKEFAKRTTPEQFQQTGETLAETGGFLGARTIPVLRQDIFTLGKNLSRFSLFKNKNFVLQQAEKTNQILRDLEKRLGTSVKDLFAGEIGNRPVNIEKATQALKTLPENVVKGLGNPKKTALFNIEYNPDGSLKNSARNMWNVRKFLDNHLTSKDFIDAGKVEKQFILNARRGLASILRDVDKSVAPIMDRFSRFAKSADRIKSITTTKGEAVGNKLQNLFTSKGEPGVRKFFTQLQELEPEIKNIVNEVTKFNRGQLLKKVVGGGIIGGGILYGARRGAARPIEVITGGGGGGGGGQ